MEISTIMSIIEQTKVDINFDIDKKVQNSPSFLKRQQQIIDVIKRNKIKISHAQKIAKDLIGYTTQPGIKAALRGNHFNRVVSDTIKAIIKNKKHIEFKTEISHCQFDEKLDWYLYNTRSKNIIAGFNQIDLWNGGAQYNRASKYILGESFHKHLSKRKIKLLCVVYNSPNKVRINTKLYKILSVGFHKKRICYLKGLKKIINEFILKE